MRYVLALFVVLAGLLVVAHPALAEDDAPVCLSDRSFVKTDAEAAYCGMPKQAPTECWRSVVAAYIWAASISGSSWADGEETDIDTDFEDIFDTLEYAFMGYVEIAYDRWSFAVDASFLKLKDLTTTPRVGATVETEMDQVILDFRLGYTAIRKQVGSDQWGSCCYPRYLTLDPVVGVRFWSLDQDLTVTLPTGQSLAAGSEESWWDPYVGARFRWQFAKRWGWTLYGDVGGFGIGDASDLTWQFQTFLRYHITRGFFVTAGYRALGTDRVTGAGATKNGIDSTMHGPMFGLGLIF